MATKEYAAFRCHCIAGLEFSTSEELLGKFDDFISTVTCKRAIVAESNAVRNKAYGAVAEEEIDAAIVFAFEAVIGAPIRGTASGHVDRGAIGACCNVGRNRTRTHGANGMGPGKLIARRRGHIG